MTVEQVAEAIGKTKWAVYKMIEEKRGVGAKFKKNEFGVWVLNKKILRRVGREHEVQK